MAVRSRALRKLLRDRLAKAAFAVIVLYAGTALAVRSGLLEAATGVDVGQPVVTAPQEVAYYSGPSGESWPATSK